MKGIAKQIYSIENKEQFAVYLASHGGNVAKAAKALGIPKQTAWDWTKKDPEFLRIREVAERTWYQEQGDRMRDNSEKAANLVSEKLDDPIQVEKMSVKDLSLVSAIMLDKATVAGTAAKHGADNTKGNNEALQVLLEEFKKIGKTNTPRLIESTAIEIE